MAYIDIDTMAPLPVAKLASLVVKTAAKPLAKRLKKDFARVPLGRASLIKVGQATNQVTTRMAIWAEGFKVRSVPPLNEEKALSEGADLLGETIVLVVSGGVVIWEYNRNSENARQKEEKRLREIEEESDALEAQLYSLDKRLEALEKVVKANSNSLLGLGGKRYVEPDMEDLVAIAAPRRKQTIAMDDLVQDLERGLETRGLADSDASEGDHVELNGREGAAEKSRWSNWWPF